MLAKAEDRRETKKLVPVAVGLDGQGQPTQALSKKLASLGLCFDASIYRKPDGKAEALFVDCRYRRDANRGPARGAERGTGDVADPQGDELPAGRRLDQCEFVRPAHGLVALHGAEVVPIAVLGLQARRVTHGHRFEAAVPAIELHTPTATLSSWRARVR